MNGESARCTRLSKLRAAFAFRLFFMYPICFLISCSFSSRRAILSSGPLDDRVKRLSYLDDQSGQSDYLDDRSGRSGCLDDRAVLSVFWRLGGAELPALSTLCLLGGRVFSTSSSLRRVTCRLSASWSFNLLSLYGGRWFSSWRVGGPFLITCDNSLFWRVVSRARSWMLVEITCICLSIGVMGGSALGLSLWVPSIIAINPCTTLFALRTTMAY